MIVSLRNSIALVCVALCLTAAARAQDTNALPALEGLVRQWVELRTEIASEDRAWREQEHQWRTELELYGSERAALTQEIDAASQQQQSHDQAQLELTTRAERLKAALDGLLPILDRAEADLRHWPARIPPPLIGPLAESFQRLPATHADSLQIPTPRRLQLVVALYAQIEDLAQHAHVVKQVLDDGTGGQREMDVLYLGLARGFAVAPDGAWAAVGEPTADGWRWKPRPDIAEPVRTVVAMQRREHAAALVSLPLQVVDVPE